ncbi:MAG: hypothetical protein GY710_03760 [Desulfobacteraceae bacterium]|nr:hypothetical protein [Desulfobacteraceae bacterium]
MKQTQQQLVQSAKLASIGELAAGVAHELNQPLMIIRNTSQLILRNMEKNRYDINLLEKDLTGIVNNSKRMMIIIDHLKKFSRQSEQDFLSVDVNMVIDNCFLMFKEQLKVDNIQITKALFSALPMVAGIPSQLEQVFLNLLINARDAINQKLENENLGLNEMGKIAILTRVAGKKRKEIEILIKDTGVGIGEQIMGTLFDPFFTTKDVGKGTGLGLSISHGIVQDHHGKIDVYDTGPGGTTFRVRLPVISA